MGDFSVGTGKSERRPRRSTRRFFGGDGGGTHDACVGRVWQAVTGARWDEGSYGVASAGSSFPVCPCTALLVSLEKLIMPLRTEQFSLFQSSWTTSLGVL